MYIISIMWVKRQPPHGVSSSFKMAAREQGAAANQEGAARTCTCAMSCASTFSSQELIPLGYNHAENHSTAVKINSEEITSSSLHNSRLLHMWPCTPVKRI